tara:strand:+ start:7817 stop:8044 length:228 start_codon:yes stop_codon:yes gene_type:complete
MTMNIGSQKDLLGYLVMQANSGQKNWFGFAQQRLTGINLAHEIAANHADTMSPDEVVDYVVKLNNAIYQKIIKVD